MGFVVVGVLEGLVVVWLVAVVAPAAFVPLLEPAQYSRTYCTSPFGPRTDQEPPARCYIVCMLLVS